MFMINVQLVTNGAMLKCQHVKLVYTILVIIQAKLKPM